MDDNAARSISLGFWRDGHYSKGNCRKARIGGYFQVLSTGPCQGSLKYAVMLAIELSDYRCPCAPRSDTLVKLMRIPLAYYF
jgi:hypothetical protein